MVILDRSWFSSSSAPIAVMLDAYEDGTDDMKEVVEEIDLQLNTLGELRGFFENAGFETELFTQGKTVIVIGKKSA